MTYLIKSEKIQHLNRGGESSESQGTTSIGWALDDSFPNKLPCGFGEIHEAECIPKLLDYDEVIYIISGILNIEIDNVVHQGKEGDVFNLPYGTTVKYSGENAKFFFVTTPTY